MAQQLEIQGIGFGAGLCLHPPGCCPTGSTCSMASPKMLPVSIPSGFLGFYDAAEYQARQILCSAQTELYKQEKRLEQAAERIGTAKSATAAYPRDTALGLTMKGSLRRFLEKRTARLRQASGSPYSISVELQSTSRQQ